jgi:hypothetical protein
MADYLKPFNPANARPGTPVNVCCDGQSFDGIIDFYSVHRNDENDYRGEVYLVGDSFPYEPSEVFLK